MHTLLTTVLSSALFLSTSVASPTPAANQVVFTQVLPEKDFVGYVVEKDASLGEVAQLTYGSEDYWTVIWDDNPTIADPNVVKKDQMLKIRDQKPAVPTQLTDVLAQRDAELTEQKNDAYLKQIGYQSVLQAQPTVVPTQAPSNSAAGISE